MARDNVEEMSLASHCLRGTKKHYSLWLLGVLVALVFVFGLLPAIPTNAEVIDYLDPQGGSVSEISLGCAFSPPAIRGGQTFIPHHDGQLESITIRIKQNISNPSRALKLLIWKNFFSMTLPGPEIIAEKSIPIGSLPTAISDVTFGGWDNLPIASGTQYTLDFILDPAPCPSPGEDAYRIENVFKFFGGHYPEGFFFINGSSNIEPNGDLRFKVVIREDSISIIQPSENQILESNNVEINLKGSATTTPSFLQLRFENLITGNQFTQTLADFQNYQLFTTSTQVTLENGVWWLSASLIRYSDNSVLAQNQINFEVSVLSFGGYHILDFIDPAGGRVDESQALSCAFSPQILAWGQTFIPDRDGRLVAIVARIRQKISNPTRALKIQIWKDYPGSITQGAQLIAEKPIPIGTLPTVMSNVVFDGWGDLPLASGTRYGFVFVLDPFSCPAPGEDAYRIDGVWKFFSGHYPDGFAVFNHGQVEHILDLRFKIVIATKPREPVIIVPGIMGSRLRQTGTLGEIEVWPNLVTMIPDPLDTWMSLLRLPETGLPHPPGDPLFTFPVDIIRRFGVGEREFFDYSQALITHLESLGYRENVDLFVFPYDWRLDVSDIATQLRDKIAIATTTSGVDKVNVIAHSMGGLVVKEYIKQFGGTAVDKLILVGVPHLGAPKAYKVLTFADPILPLSLILNQFAVRDAAQNFPAVYQLLPGQSYFVTDPNNPDFFFYRYYVNDTTDVDQNGIRGELDFDQTRQLMINQGRNAQLFPLADAVHSSLDNWRGSDFGVQTFNIVGCESATLGQFILQNPLFGFIGKKFRPIYIDGDKTVPLRSAESVGSDRIFYYKTLSAPQEVEHARLLTAPGMPELIGDILTTGNLTLPSYVTTRRSECSLSGFMIGDDIPVELHIYDSQGRHAGPLPNGDLEIGIPGAQYDRFEDEKYAFLPMGDTYRIVFQGTQAGSAAISIQPVVNNTIAQTISYFDVPIASASTTAKFMLTPTLEDLILHIDQNGDGIFEASTTPSTILNAIESLDFVPPETVATTSGAIGLNGWFTSDVHITLTATDNSSGSDIFKTEYSLDDGESWQRYETPILITQEGEVTVLYHSIDRAGNSENANTLMIKVDKTPPTISHSSVNTSYLFNTQLLFSFDAVDTISGLESINATFSDVQVGTNTILSLTKPGVNTIRITATDMAGNQSVEAITFDVIYEFIGFLPPINNDGSSIFQFGQTVPTKFQLKDANGQFLSNITSFIFVVKLSDNVVGTEFAPESTATANVENIFRYDIETNKYIFNLSTDNLSVGTWRIRADLGDGSDRIVVISLK